MYNIILPLNLHHIYLHDLHLIKPQQTSHIPTRFVSHYHCSLIPWLLLHVEPSGLFIWGILLSSSTMNLFFMKIPWKCLEKPMNAFLMDMKTEISGFMAFICTIEFPWNFEGWFSWAMKSLQKHWKWFSWAIKFWSISDWQNSWPMKILVGHEIPMKAFLDHFFSIAS